MSISGVGGSAQVVRSFQPPSFSSLDSDSSGGISLEELEAGAPGGATDGKSTERAKKLFAQMDTDGNGSVSSDEKDVFDSKIESQRQAMQFMAQLLGNTQLQQPNNSDVFAATDTDGNGSVSLDEFSSTAGSTGLSTNDLSTLFGIIDSDSDGSISSTESSDFLDTLKEATSGPQSGPPPGPPPGGMGGPGGPGGPPPDATASSDSDSDSDSSSSANSDLFSLAAASYTKTSKQTDLLTAITNLLQKAA